MFTVAQVLNPEFPRSWHEAVAIVQDVASQLGTGLTVPAPQHLSLDDNGALTLGFASEGDENPVIGVAELLGALLDGVEAPAGLADLVKENARPSPAHASLESFTKALSFYERPNRANDLLALVNRLRAARPAPTPEAEFEKLREKLTLKDPPPESPIAKLRLNRRQRTYTVVAVIATVVFVFAAASRRATSTRESSKEASPTQGTGVIAQAEDSVSKAVSAGLKRLGLGDSSVPVEAPDPRPTPPSPPISRTTIRNAVSHPPVKATRAPRAAAAESSGPANGNEEVVAPVGLVSAPPDDGSAPLPLSDGTSASVFSTIDAGVEPPLFVRPQLPSAPPPGADTGYFDLVVNESGDVEEVKLISPSRRFHDRMLVAAAKAWKFRPALLDGLPVRYRMRVAIILPQGMP